MLFTFKDRLPSLNPYWDKYIALQKCVQYPAKTVLLQEGKKAQNYYFVVQGCLRLCFDNNGKDKTVQFFFENEGVASLESFRKNIASIFTIETIEPGTLQVLPKAVFNDMLEELDQNPVFLKALMDISFERQRHYMNEFLSRIRDTPLHLSRIKNKLAGKK